MTTQWPDHRKWPGMHRPAELSIGHRWKECPSHYPGVGIVWSLSSFHHNFNGRTHSPAGIVGVILTQSAFTISGAALAQSIGDHAQRYFWTELMICFGRLVWFLLCQWIFNREYNVILKECALDEWEWSGTLGWLANHRLFITKF